MAAPLLREREPLARHTSLKVGGPADFYAEAHDTDQLTTLLALGLDRQLPTRIIGGGSNLLVSDAGVEGLVIRPLGSHFDVLQPDGAPVVVAGAGVTFANLARRLSQQGFGGLEWATNVPGTVGGAVVNNAGAFGGETSRDLVSATVVFPNGTTRTLLPDELGYHYRGSLLKQKALGALAVAEARFRVQRTSPAASREIVRRFQEQRTRSQPRQLSAGSVFANPEGDFSGRLIEEAGLKGARVGGAQVSPHHANFIVNVGGATAADVFALIQQVQATVAGRSGVWLRTEIELFGRWDPRQRDALASDPGSIAGRAS